MSSQYLTSGRPLPITGHDDYKEQLCDMLHDMDREIELQLKPLVLKIAEDLLVDPDVLLQRAQDWFKDYHKRNIAALSKP